MIKVSVLYPHSDSATFDMNYYCTITSKGSATAPRRSERCGVD